MFSSPYDRAPATIKPELQLFTGRMESLRASKNRSIEGESGEEKKIYSCKICPNEYDSETELESHKAKVHSRYLYLRSRINKNTCRVCRKVKKTEEDLFKHIKTVHFLSTCTTKYVERDIFICDHCSRIFFNKRMLIIHISRHMKVKTDPECPKCFRILKSQYTYMTHLELHYINSVGTCPICFNKFQDRNAMLSHVFEAHKMVYNCTVCNYAFEKMSPYARHMENDHNQPSNFASYLSVTKEVLNRCFVSSTPVPSTPFLYTPYTPAKGLNIAGLIHVCVLCRALCKNETEQREHISRMHLQPTRVFTKKVYGCSCGEDFYNNVLLKHHIFTLKGTHCVREAEVMESKGDDSTVAVNANDDSDEEIVHQISDSSQELPEMDKEVAEMDKEVAEMDKEVAEMDKEDAEIDKELPDMDKEDVVRVIEIFDDDNDETLKEVVIDPHEVNEDEMNGGIESKDDEDMIKLIE
ncbi:hypothetical protein JYU34_008121 [Plutella xylostella]|uniref:C2H2-type domain-containing protein n=1 Tax=Plutella xylostella TaxID=51655 RepID=A0ABQ7QNU0_PLUXY|nr:hypothetical protein JYU34_008121 [Plutella xylostella]